MKFKPLIIGLPRSGFSLSAAVLHEIYNQVDNKESEYIKKIRKFCDTLGYALPEAIDKKINELGLTGRLFFNQNFRQTPGGPIWNYDELGQRAYFRKYIGIQGKGDFTIITSHPLQLLDYYQVVHSHGPFSDWLKDNPFSEYDRFASARNPAGVINSACFSINALASEYIQRSPSELNAEEIRQSLALYKLSDMKFFNALLGPLKKGLQDQVKHKNDYFQIYWENLVTTPAAEISRIVGNAKLSQKDVNVGKIWEKIGFRNLTGAHLHNYRVGKAYVGDELESLTVEHIEIMKATGIDDLASEFGYALPKIETKNYSKFQRAVSDAIQSGKPIDEMKDRELFNYAFQKSNIDFSHFNFRQYGWKKNSKLERSNIKDPEIELEIWEVSDIEVERFNHGYALLQLHLTDVISEHEFLVEIKNLNFQRKLYSAFCDSWKS